MKFVIVGLGSIGKRHQENLLALGQEVIECHRNDDLKKLLKKYRPDGVLICNPTALHIPTALQAAAAMDGRSDERVRTDSRRAATDCLHFDPGWLPCGLRFLCHRADGIST